MWLVSTSMPSFSPVCLQVYVQQIANVCVCVCVCVRACVRACVRVCVHGMYTRPIVKKTTQEYRRWQEREGPDSKIVSRITDQAALTLLPKGFAETVPWNCDYFTHTSVQSVSRVLRSQRKTQVLLKEMKMQNIAIYKPKKDQCNVCLGHKYGTVS